MKSACKFILILFALCVAPLSAREGQPAGSQEPKVTVRASDSLAPQDWDIRVPITATVAEGTQVGRLMLRVVYPTKVLTFKELELAVALKDASFEATAEPVVPPPSDENSAMLIAISTPKGEPKAIPSDALLNVIFRTSNLVDPGTWPVTVEGVQAWSATSPPTAVIADAGPAATITVAPAGLPIFACFFYMH